MCRTIRRDFIYFTEVKIIWGLEGFILQMPFDTLGSSAVVCIYSLQGSMCWKCKSQSNSTESVGTTGDRTSGRWWVAEAPPCLSWVIGLGVEGEEAVPGRSATPGLSHTHTSSPESLQLSALPVSDDPWASYSGILWQQCHVKQDMGWPFLSWSHAAPLPRCICGPL